MQALQSFALFLPCYVLEADSTDGPDYKVSLGLL